MSGPIFNIIQSLIIITLCLIILYPKAIERYRNKKKLRETQREQESYEKIKQLVNRYLEEIKNDGGTDKGTTEGSKIP